MAPNDPRSPPPSPYTTLLRPTYSHTPCSQLCVAIFSSTAPSFSSPTNHNNVALPCGHIFHDMCIRAYLAKSGTCPRCPSPSLGSGMEEACRKLREAAEGLRGVGEEIRRVARGMGERRVKKEMGVKSKEVGVRARRERKTSGKTNGKVKERREKKKAKREKGVWISGGKRKSLGHGSGSEGWEWDTEVEV